MIKVKELRIGNKVIYNNAKIIVSGTMLNKLTFGDYIINMDTDKAVSISNIFPIDFSQNISILHQIGFHKFQDDIFNGENYWKDDKENIVISLDNKKYSFYEYDGMILHNPSGLKQCTYLHLLQNQYYFMTGNELDVSQVK